MKSFKKIAIILGSLLAILFISLAFMLFWEGNTKEIISVADEFKAPSSWRLKSEMIRPPKVVCLDGGTCPEVARLWTSDKQLTKEDFDKILKDSGFTFPIKGDCLAPSNSAGDSIYLCDASGVVRNFDVSISISENSTTQQQKISIDVRPH